MANVSPLEEVAISGDIDRLYALIQRDPYILEHVDAIPFVDTPLHVAASAGHLQFAAEIMKLKPSFALKLNPQGFSPIHLALQNNHKELVVRFVYIKKDLVRVKGREDITPLHFVSQTGEIDLLAKFLSACPDSIEDVTVRSETALHIAVKYQQFEALHVLVGWLKRNTGEGAGDLEHSILNWKDVAGNTILHLAALNDDTQALDLLINSKMMMMNLDAKDSENLTALDKAASTEIERKLWKAGTQHGSSVEDDPTLADQLRSKITVRRKIITRIRRMRASISDNDRDAYLVVATLILNGIYQSALSSPGSFRQDDNGANNLKAATATHQKLGKSVLSENDFLSLSGLNMVALFFTTNKILFLLPSGWIGFQLVVLTFLFAFSYLWSLRLISPTPGARQIVNITIGFFFVIYYLVVIELINNLLPLYLLPLFKIWKKKILRRLNK